LLHVVVLVVVCELDKTTATPVTDTWGLLNWTGMKIHWKKLEAFQHTLDISLRQHCFHNAWEQILCTINFPLRLSLAVQHRHTHADDHTNVTQNNGQPRLTFQKQIRAGQSKKNVIAHFRCQFYQRTCQQGALLGLKTQFRSFWAPPWTFLLQKQEC